MKNYVFQFQGGAPELNFMAGEIIVFQLEAKHPPQLIEDHDDRHYFFVKNGVGLEQGGYSNIVIDGRTNEFSDGTTTMLNHVYGVTIVDSAVTGSGMHIEDWYTGMILEVSGLYGDYRRGVGNVKLLYIYDLNPV